MNVAKKNHKEAAVSYLKLVSSGKIREVYDKYVDQSFNHHNPYFDGDAESLAAGMEENAKKFPNKIFDIKHILEDGDFVAVHSRLQLGANEPEIAVVHIFRFKNSKIVELWDLGQQVPKDSPNENGMF